MAPQAMHQATRQVMQQEDPQTLQAVRQEDQQENLQVHLEGLGIHQSEIRVWEKSSAAALHRMNALRYTSWQRCMARKKGSMTTVKTRMMQSLC